MIRLSAAALLLASTAALAQTPVTGLAKPPANATHRIIESTGGKHGDSWSWVAADGTRWGRESLNLRGQVWETDSAVTLGKDGLPAKLTVRGVTPQGDAGETFGISGGTAVWKSQVDAGSARYGAPKLYNSFSGPIDLTALFLERLLAAPNQTLDLLPGGRAHAEKLTTITVGTGAKTKQIVAWSITGINNSPVPVWADTNGKFFGLNVGIAWFPDGYEDALKPTEKAQNDAMAAKIAALSHSLPKVPAGPVAFTHVKLFDADAGVFRADQTVVVDKGVIAAVGPAASTVVPAGAQRIDGTGKTLVPGLWDCHMHVGDNYTGVQELSLGVTSVRDPGNSDTATMERARRRAAGDLLFPHVYASSLKIGRAHV